MQEKLEQLKALYAEIVDLGQAAALISWDQQTYMPQGGAEARGNQLAALSEITHQKATAPALGRLLEELASHADSLDPESYDARLVRVGARDFAKATRVPSEFVAEMARVTTAANEAWRRARQQDDFAAFQPHLEKVLEMVHRYIDFYPPADHPYDVLLDDYEPGMKTAEVQQIFNTLRPQQVELIRAIAARPAPDDSFLHAHFPEADQLAFGREVITRFGFDWTRGRQDKSTHPFCTSFGKDDVRITTRVDENFFNTMFFGTVHETGHALYEQGYHQYIQRTPLANGASMAVHESQSRLWENLVARSRPFWQHFYPRLQQAFPSQLGGVSMEQFYRAINKVQPSLIRVEADEATYNLHIMLRLELEIAMLEGSIKLKDLPELWNAKSQEYLGLTPPNNAKGVLQDIHWSWGNLGYFPTYALGNLVSAQLWEKFHTLNPDIDEQISQGDFSALFSWLHVKIHQVGRAFEPQELVQRVTGSRITPEPYLRYLRSKFGDLYGL